MAYSGQNRRKKGDSPSYLHTHWPCLWNGASLASANPFCPPTHPAICLRCLGMLVRGYQERELEGPAPRS